ncbi:MAG: DUF6516 family protein [Nitrospiraceae bacterium]|nr:DUF6516 family protein [Nitrospiraceae bacterium]
MFYKLVEDFAKIIVGYKVVEYRRYGSATSLVAKIEFKDGSSLSVKDYLFLNGKRKYSYHWQDSQGNLISRWDDSPHHKKVSTFPHHRHLPDEIVASKERTIKDVLKIIRSTGSEEPKT